MSLIAGVGVGAVLLQAAVPAVHVGFIPEHPSQGSFVIVVASVATGGEHDSVVRLQGSLAGQPLHFVPVDNGFRSLAGIPVSARETIPVTVSAVTLGGDTIHTFARLPVQRVEYSTERLRVDPRFSERPDSALARRIRAESRAARRASRLSHATERLWRGSFVRPSDGRITSSFGTGREFNGELRSRHLGVDFDGTVGQPVQAPNRGVVALVGEFYYGGNVIYIDHGHGLVTGYMHLSETLVARGDTVDAGQVIGKIGATGRVTGPHLHWIGRYGTVTVDPLSLLELDPADLLKAER